jgi:hypothetical protein
MGIIWGLVLPPLRNVAYDFSFFAKRRFFLSPLLIEP